MRVSRRRGCSTPCRSRATRADRHRARERALQILFQWDARKEPIEASISSFYDTLYSEQSETRPAPDEFVDRLVNGVVENIAEIDRRLSQHAEHWRIERMPAVDRNVLRLAIFEMMALDTPPPVAIDEERVDDPLDDVVRTHLIGLEQELCPA